MLAIKWHLIQVCYEAAHTEGNIENGGADSNNLQQVDAPQQAGKGLLFGHTAGLFWLLKTLHFCIGLVKAASNHFSGSWPAACMLYSAIRNMCLLSIESLQRMTPSPCSAPGAPGAPALLNYSVLLSTTVQTIQTQ